jgi:phosphoribosylformylglycinamidine (FGAM) synthase-like enzyme
MEIWSNEAQERYVLAIRPESLEQFEEICARVGIKGGYWKINKKGARE